MAAKSKRFGIVWCCGDCVVAHIVSPQEQFSSLFRFPLSVVSVNCSPRILNGKFKK
jgi:hypothetical protein